MKKINECKARIRDLKQQIQQFTTGRQMTSLQIYTQKHPSANNRRPPALRQRKRLPGHFGKIYALHWASNSEDIVSASQDGKLLVWNTLSTNKKKLLFHYEVHG